MCTSTGSLATSWHSQCLGKLLRRYAELLCGRSNIDPPSGRPGKCSFKLRFRYTQFYRCTCKYRGIWQWSLTLTLARSLVLPL